MKRIALLSIVALVVLVGCVNEPPKVSYEDVGLSEPIEEETNNYTICEFTGVDFQFGKNHVDVIPSNEIINSKGIKFVSTFAGREDIEMVYRPGNKPGENINYYYRKYPNSGWTYEHTIDQITPDGTILQRGTYKLWINAVIDPSAEEVISYTCAFSFA